MKKTIVVTAIAAATLASAASVQAQGFYVFGEAASTEATSSEAESVINAKQGEFSKTTSDFNDLLGSYPDGTVDANGDVLVADVVQTDSSSSDDSSDTTFSAGLGYRFHKNFAAEFAYRDLGDAAYAGKSVVTGSNASGVATYENSYESEAYILRGVAILPLTDRFALEGLLGVAYVDTDYAYSEQVKGEGYLNSEQSSGSSSGSDFTATYGVGASFDVTDSFTTYARWERIHEIDTESEFDGIEADTFSAGVRYYF